MSIVVLMFLGLIADAGVVLYFGWGVISAVMAGSLFDHIAATGLAGLTIASALVAIAGASMLLAHSHAMFRDTRYRRHISG